MNASEFQTHRGRVFAIAYRMTGQASVAEDVVQETWLKWHRAKEIERPSAWLNTVATRLCLDELGTARRRREQYVGPWLPEPVHDDGWSTGPEQQQSLSMAFLLLLQQLTAPQRAAFLLREVFEQDYVDIAEVLDRTPASCRQLVRRARLSVERSDVRFDVASGAQQIWLETFATACASGDLDGLVALLAEDATAWSDGGGVVVAALRPIQGQVRVARFLLGVLGKAPADMKTSFLRLNGQPAVAVWRDTVLFGAWLFDLRDGRLVGLRSVLNPAKLAWLQARIG